jgi:putative AbiEi antitoxin of type IV toxin-antitoxin system
MLGMTLAPGLAALAAAQGGVFTTAQALAAGYNGDEIGRLRRSGSWVRLRRGVYAERSAIPDGAAARHLLQLRAALLTLSGPAAASHVTAAAMHGLALLDPDFSLVHITRNGVGSSRTEADVRHHDASLPLAHLTKLDGVLTTSAARTVVDLARVATYQAALVATESALNRELTTLRELRDVMESCKDWPGARDAGRVVAFASPYSESAGETLGRIAFDELGVPPPRQQVLIYDRLGLIARCDYFFEGRHTVGEFDGRLKYVGENAEDDALYKEKLREDRLREAGLEVFRIGYAESLAKKPSVRRKALAAFERAAGSSRARAYRCDLPPPRE